MGFSLSVLLVGDSSAQLVPAVNKRLERRLQSHTVEAGSDPRVVIQNRTKSILQQRALNDDGFDLKFSPAVITFHIANQQSVTGGLSVLSGSIKVIGISLNPRNPSVIIPLPLIEVLDGRDHSKLSIGRHVNSVAGSVRTSVSSTVNGRHFTWFLHCGCWGSSRIPWWFGGAYTVGGRRTGSGYKSRMLDVEKCKQLKTNSYLCRQWICTHLRFMTRTS